MGETTYDLHPAVARVAQWRDDLPRKTGRTLDEWVNLVRAAGLPDDRARREWLKAEHGFNGHAAGWLAARAAGVGTWEDDPDTYLTTAPQTVAAMFAGKKRALLPLYETLLTLARGLGPDVRVCPCQTIVPLYRAHVFAQVKPTTNTRIDLGLALGDTPALGRLIDTGGLARKDRITHRIPIETPDAIDAEVTRWLRAAYDRDA